MMMFRRLIQDIVMVIISTFTMKSGVNVIQSSHFFIGTKTSLGWIFDFSASSAIWDHKYLHYVSSFHPFFFTKNEQFNQF